MMQENGVPPSIYISNNSIFLAQTIINTHTEIRINTWN